MTMGKGNVLEYAAQKSAPLAYRRLYIVPVMCYNRVVDGVFSLIRAARLAVPDNVRIHWSNCHG
jgi:hypothetical protein